MASEQQTKTSVGRDFAGDRISPALNRQTLILRNGQQASIRGWVTMLDAFLKLTQQEAC